MSLLIARVIISNFLAVVSLVIDGILIVIFECVVFWDAREDRGYLALEHRNQLLAGIDRQAVLLAEHGGEVLSAVVLVDEYLLCAVHVDLDGDDKFWLFFNLNLLKNFIDNGSGGHFFSDFAVCLNVRLGGAGDHAAEVVGGLLTDVR